MFEELNEYYIGQQQDQNLAAELAADDADIWEQQRFNLSILSYFFTNKNNPLGFTKQKGQTMATLSTAP